MNNIKQKSYISILFSVGAIFALLYFGAVYLAEKEENISLEIIDKKKKMEQLRMQNEQIEKTRSAYENWQKEIKYVSGSVVSYSKLFDYIIEIENLASKSNVGLEKEAFAENKGELCENFLYTYYKIKISGSFDNIMKFLTRLENLKYYSDLENIKIASENKTGIKDNDLNSGKIILDADLKIYVRDENNNNE